MAEEQALAYRVLRYTPNILREEFIHVGVLLQAPGAQRSGVRMLNESEYGRLRRLHPEADLELLRGLGAALGQALARSPSAWPMAEAIEKLEENLSNAVQFSPAKGVLAEDFDAELDRLYEEQIRPVATRGRLGAMTEHAMGWIRRQVKDALRRARIYERMAHGVSVEEYTYPGDPMRLDHGYQRNGTRGFIHALPLGRDAGPARSLALTVSTMRKRMERLECYAICEAVPQAGDRKQIFIAELMSQPEVGVKLWPVTEAGKLAQQLAPELR